MSQSREAPTAAKVRWIGEVISIQSRIRLMRSFDERSRSYLGYVLRLHGTTTGEAREFSRGVGKSAHAKYAFRIGDRISGAVATAADARLKPVEFYSYPTPVQNILYSSDITWQN